VTTYYDLQTLKMSIFLVAAGLVKILSLSNDLELYWSYAKILFPAALSAKGSQ